MIEFHQREIYRLGRPQNGTSFHLTYSKNRGDISQSEHTHCDRGIATRVLYAPIAVDVLNGVHSKFDLIVDERTGLLNPSRD